MKMATYYHLLCFLILYNQLQIVLSLMNKWTYHGITADVKQWCMLFPPCCGKSQSPVNFQVPTQHNPLDKQNAFVFTNYDVTPKKMSLSNTGQSIQLTITDPAVKPQISGGLLNKTYNFHSIHFHWGKSSLDGEGGAEHTFGGRTFPMELHIVHYASTYPNLSFALLANKPDSLAVLGVVFKLEWFSNSALKPIIEMLGNIQFRRQRKSLATPFKLNDLLPPETGQFYRYFGSLTTPPCNQVVVWTIFGVSSYISEKQLEKFRTLMTTAVGEEPPEPMSDNFRPPQKLNQRTVFVSNE